MTKKITFAFATMLFFYLTIKAQTYELDQVKQIPSISPKNMGALASSIKKLFDDAIKEPEKNSTTKAVSETVYGFYDKREVKNRYQKVNPISGAQYTSNDADELRKNNRLLFNLTFDEKGNLLVPEKIYVISNREEDQKDRTIKKVGRLAFELTVTDSIKTELSKLHLQNLAKVDINSLTGALNPVTIQLPFDLHYGITRPEPTSGNVTKSGDQIHLTLKRYLKDDVEEIKYIDILKKYSELLEYKRGEFEFRIEESYIFTSVKINILVDTMLYGSDKEISTGGVSTKVETVTEFKGDGKKIKK